MFPESQFVFDLELPLEFKPRVGDGEVQDFYLLPIQRVSFSDRLEYFCVLRGDTEHATSCFR